MDTAQNLDIAGNALPTEEWKNEGEMVEWGNKIKDLRNLLHENTKIQDELKETVREKDYKIEEMREIIHHLATALSKFINEDL
tara:strand:+ start:241 stop:489 length:249 start_codon:yes stop_codon:yes gene_type:complete